jgi:hypothetical protein
VKSRGIVAGTGDNLVISGQAGGKNPAAVLPGSCRLPGDHQAQVRLVDQGRGFQRLSRLLPSQSLGGQRSSSYTSGSSSAAACGSPASMADRMRVTWFMPDTLPQGEHGFIVA